MDKELRRKILVEFLWLAGIIAISAAVEFAIIKLFDLHPILSVKIQGLIGLVIIAYMIRMIARMGNQGLIPFADEEENVSNNNEQSSKPN